MTKIEKKKDNFRKIYGILDQCSNENILETMKKAIEYGYNDIQDYYGNKILTKATSKNNLNLAKMLVQCGDDPSFLGDSKRNALYIFCREGNLEAVKFFASQPNIDPNSPNVDNWTTLMIAVKYDHYEVVQYLLTLKGIDINAKNVWNETALQQAKSERMRNLLIKNGAV